VETLARGIPSIKGKKKRGSQFCIGTKNGLRCEIRNPLKGGLEEQRKVETMYHNKVGLTVSKGREATGGGVGGGVKRSSTKVKIARRFGGE